ncbi:464_t:CDS:10 [Entrophospora sp. SA101]|nr:464_t:CDS:10 [Entrophospora sp. SA101]
MSNTSSMPSSSFNNNNNYNMSKSHNDSSSHFQQSHYQNHNNTQHDHYNEVEEFVTIEKNIVTSQNVEELFDKVLKLVSQPRKLSMSSLSPSLSSSMANSPLFSSTSTSLSSTSALSSMKGKKSLPSSPSLSLTPAEIGNPLAMERQSLDQFQYCGLFAQSNILLGNFIAEYKGKICLKSDYTDDPANEYKDIGTTKPYVLFYPTLNLCMDARHYGTHSRFVRRSCNPNAETRTMYINDGIVKDRQLHLGIFAKCHIMQDQEITVGWDWDNNHYTECACENKNKCVIEKMKKYAKKQNDDLTRNKGYVYPQQSNLSYYKNAGNNYDDIGEDEDEEMEEIYTSTPNPIGKNNDHNNYNTSTSSIKNPQFYEIDGNFQEFFDLYDNGNDGDDEYTRLGNDRNKFNNKLEMRGNVTNEMMQPKQNNNHLSTTIATSTAAVKNSSKSDFISSPKKRKLSSASSDISKVRDSNLNFASSSTSSNISTIKNKYLKEDTEIIRDHNQHQPNISKTTTSSITSNNIPTITSTSTNDNNVDGNDNFQNTQTDSFKYSQINLPRSTTLSSSSNINPITNISTTLPSPLPSSKIPTLTSPTTTTSHYDINKTSNPTTKASSPTISTPLPYQLETSKTTSNTSQFNIYPNNNKSSTTTTNTDFPKNTQQSDSTKPPPSVTTSSSPTTTKPQANDSLSKRKISFSEYKQMKGLNGSPLTSKTDEPKKHLSEPQSNNLSSPLPPYTLPSTTSPTSLSVTNANIVTTTSKQPLLVPHSSSYSSATEQQNKNESISIKKMESKIEEPHSSTPDSQKTTLINDGYFPVDFNFNFPNIYKSRNYSYDYHTSKDVDSINPNEYVSPPSRGLPPSRNFQSGGGSNSSGGNHYRGPRSSSGGPFRVMPISPRGYFNSPSSSPTTSRHPNQTNTPPPPPSSSSSILMSPSGGWGMHDRREWRDRDREREERKEWGKRNEDYRFQRFPGDMYRSDDNDKKKSSVEKLANKMGKVPSDLPAYLQNENTAKLILQATKQMGIDDPALLIRFDNNGFNDTAVLNCRNGVPGQTQGALIAYIVGSGGVNFRGLNKLFLFRSCLAISRCQYGFPPWAHHQPGVADVCISICRISKLSANGGIDYELFDYPLKFK